MATQTPVKKVPPTTLEYSKNLQDNGDRDGSVSLPDFVKYFQFTNDKPIYYNPETEQTAELNLHNLFVDIDTVSHMKKDGTIERWKLSNDEKKEFGLPTNGGFTLPVIDECAEWNSFDLDVRKNLIAIKNNLAYKLTLSRACKNIYVLCIKSELWVAFYSGYFLPDSIVNRTAKLNLTWENPAAKQKGTWALGSPDTKKDNMCEASQKGGDVLTAVDVPLILVLTTGFSLSEADKLLAVKSIPGKYCGNMGIPVAEIRPKGSLPPNKFFVTQENIDQLTWDFMVQVEGMLDGVFRGRDFFIITILPLHTVFNFARTFTTYNKYKAPFKGFLSFKQTMTPDFKPIEKRYFLVSPDMLVESESE